MAEVLKFHLVSPERKLASLDAISVTLPGIEGDLTVLPNHATFLTSLRPGILSVSSDAGTEEFVVTGGFADVSESTATILAEKSIPKEEANNDFVVSLIEEAEEELETVTESRKASAALRLNDLKVLKELIN